MQKIMNRTWSIEKMSKFWSILNEHEKQITSIANILILVGILISIYSLNQQNSAQKISEISLELSKKQMLLELIKDENAFAHSKKQYMSKMYRYMGDKWVLDDRGLDLMIKDLGLESKEYNNNISQIHEIAEYYEYIAYQYFEVYDQDFGFPLLEQRLKTYTNAFPVFTAGQDKKGFKYSNEL